MRSPLTVPRVCGVLAAAALGALLLPVWPVLRVSDEGSTIGYLPLSEGERFTITYMHSIDHLPIEEDLVLRDGRLVAETTRIRQFGAGMGQIPGEGTGYADGEWWVIDDMGRDVGTELALRVGSPTVDHRLLADGTEVRLSPCLAAHRVTLDPARAATLPLLVRGAPHPRC
ncbi:DUF1850 domain-containing protein [Nocardiopsis aegyptia]|uniref:DUF1850 domain-containing protein n=1 Tax=Nocardiopsis aegyptia TaxID=220378 RepID=A0A7Z0JBD2_9ACTN|nr:DUF1850 domain-containing protein [Nocardiopsis aegyptia]NYJ36213.1 hypothetical protein [Nocardiopsis aegyptia]